MEQARVGSKHTSRASGVRSWGWRPRFTLGQGLALPSVDIASSPGVQGREAGGLSSIHHPCNKGL